MTHRDFTYINKGETKQSLYRRGRNDTPLDGEGLIGFTIDEGDCHYCKIVVYGDSQLRDRILKLLREDELREAGQ